MATEAQLSIDPRRVDEAAAIAGSEAELFDAMTWAQRALDPGHLLRLRDQLATPAGLPRAVAEILDRWRGFHAMAGPVHVHQGGNVTTPAQEARR